MDPEVVGIGSSGDLPTAVLGKAVSPLNDEVIVGLPREANWRGRIWDGLLRASAEALKGFEGALTATRGIPICWVELHGKPRSRVAAHAMHSSCNELGVR